MDLLKLEKLIHLDKLCTLFNKKICNSSINRIQLLNDSVVVFLSTQFTNFQYIHDREI